MSYEQSPNSPPITASNAQWHKELGRLAHDYAKRDASAVDQRAWSPLIPEAHWLDFSIQRFLAASLMQQGWKPDSIGTCEALEVGCGNGRILQWLHQFGIGSLDGIEALPSRVEAAKKQAPYASIRQANMGQLPYPDKAFDCVVQVVTFSSCLDQGLRLAAASEMLRVLRPGGSIFWCDFKPMQGQAAYAQGIGVKELKQLFPNCEMRVRSFGANPQWLGKLTSLVNQGPVRWLTGKRRPATKLPLLAASVMEKCPWLTTYVGAVITCPQ